LDLDPTVTVQDTRGCATTAGLRSQGPERSHRHEYARPNLERSFADQRCTVFFLHDTSGAIRTAAVTTAIVGPAKPRLRVRNAAPKPATRGEGKCEVVGGILTKNLPAEVPCPRRWLIPQRLVTTARNSRAPTAPQCSNAMLKRSSHPGDTPVPQTKLRPPVQTNGDSGGNLSLRAPKAMVAEALRRRKKGKIWLGYDPFIHTGRKHKGGLELVPPIAPCITRS
jgi:hypothetical protein